MRKEGNFELENLYNDIENYLITNDNGLKDILQILTELIVTK